MEKDRYFRVSPKPNVPCSKLCPNGWNTINEDSANGKHFVWSLQQEGSILQEKPTSLEHHDTHEAVFPLTLDYTSQSKSPGFHGHLKNRSVTSTKNPLEINHEAGPYHFLGK